jgi:hypothetical protein
MRLLGEIVRLQVQVVSLKVGEPNRRRYDPAGIREVSQLLLSENGVEGINETGAILSDVHNLTHPLSKNRRGTNGISIGFTSHYAAMRDRFGVHLVDGISGENLLVRVDESERIFAEDEFAGGLVVQGSHGDPVRVTNVFVAAPCAEFSRFALRFPDEARPDRTVTEAVQFLDAGMRGFYAAYKGDPARVSLGDSVYLLGRER